jgi:hypothetical protein
VIYFSPSWKAENIYFSAARCAEVVDSVAALAAKKEEIFAMKKFVVACLASAVMFMMLGVAFAADTTTVNGYVSDSKCGAKGANAKAAECTKKCIQGGAKMVVVTDGDQKVLTVDNPDQLTGHEGHHVAVTGTVTGESIHVDSVKML